MNDLERYNRELDIIYETYKLALDPSDDIKKDLKIFELHVRLCTLRFLGKDPDPFEMIYSDENIELTKMFFKDLQGVFNQLSMVFGTKLEWDDILFVTSLIRFVTVEIMPTYDGNLYDDVVLIIMKEFLRIGSIETTVYTKDIPMTFRIFCKELINVTCMHMDDSTIEIEGTRFRFFHDLLYLTIATITDEF